MMLSYITKKMSDYCKLCLGTAQFGLDYGVTNTSGKVSHSKAYDILTLAAKFKFEYLDTAQAYGDSEYVIGCNNKISSRYRLITKLLPQHSQFFTSDDIVNWEQSFKESCCRLNVSTIDTLLLHSSADLLKPGNQYLRNWLKSLKDRGLVLNIGVSIYESSDLIGLVQGSVDVVQLPISLFDQRLILDGTIENLSRAGVKVYARSIFLQGLMVTHSSKWPNWIDPSFVNHMFLLERMAEVKNCEVIDLVLSFVKSQRSLHGVVIAVCNTTELAQIMNSWNLEAKWADCEWSQWAWNECSTLDPRLWPSK